MFDLSSPPSEMTGARLSTRSSCIRTSAGRRLVGIDPNAGLHLWLSPHPDHRYREKASWQIPLPILSLDLSAPPPALLGRLRVHRQGQAPRTSYNWEALERTRFTMPLGRCSASSSRSGVGVCHGECASPMCPTSVLSHYVASRSRVPCRYHWVMHAAASRLDAPLDRPTAVFGYPIQRPFGLASSTLAINWPRDWLGAVNSSQTVGDKSCVAPLDALREAHENHLLLGEICLGHDSFRAVHLGATRSSRHIIGAPPRRQRQVRDRERTALVAPRSERRILGAG